jgi:hypothetical protein
MAKRVAGAEYVSDTAGLRSTPFVVTLNDTVPGRSMGGVVHLRVCLSSQIAGIVNPRPPISEAIGSVGSVGSVERFGSVDLAIPLKTQLRFEDEMNSEPVTVMTVPPETST